MGFLSDVFSLGEDRRVARNRATEYRAGVTEARTESARIADEAMRSEEFTTSRDFLTGLLDYDPDKPFAQGFQRTLRQAQASRGLFFSPAAAQHEALAQSQYLLPFQLQAASQLQNFIGFRERFRQSIFPQLADTAVRFNTGGRRAFESLASEVASPISALGPVEDLAWSAVGAAVGGPAGAMIGGTLGGGSPSNFGFSPQGGLFGGAGATGNSFAAQAQQHSAFWR